MWAKTKASNWINKPYTRGTTAWKVQQYAGKAARITKGIGVGAAIFSGVVGGYEQYQKDSANPSMGEGKKLVRAGTQAVTQGTLGYAGAWGGAQIGMAIGAVGGPVGVAVGGIVGGAVGGIAGSGFGKWLGDKINAARS